MRRFIRDLPGGVPLRLSIAAAALLVLTRAEGLAQHGRAFETFPGLTATDIAIVQKLVREDLTGKPKGTTLPWSNPETENSGSVTLIARFPSRGRDCRRVRYLVKPGPRQASADAGTYVLTSCRLSDGTWQLDSQAKPDAPAR